MARDLDLGVSVEGVATVRELDGLALSSRNAYLSPAHRQLAPRFYEALTAASEAVRAGAPIVNTLQAVGDKLRGHGFEVQYLNCLQLPTFEEAKLFSPDRPYLLAGAVYLGATRLIDNIIVNPMALDRDSYRHSAGN